MTYESAFVEEVPGEPFRFYVRSEPRGQRYLVDLTENKGWGCCGCKAFAFKHGDNQKTGNYVPHGFTGATDCKHIALARHHFTKHVAIPMMASQSQ